MDYSLQKESLLQSMGKELKNTKGKPMGKVVEFIPIGPEEPIRYLVLQTSILFGLNDRFFAIPNLSEQLVMGENDEITLKISEEDLVFATGIHGKVFPEPFLNKGAPIFEIYGYESEPDS